MRPFELCYHHVLRRGDPDGCTGDLGRLAPGELLAAEGALLAQDQVHLPAALEQHDVEPSATTPRVVGGFGTDVEPIRIESGHERIERQPIAVDHPIDVVRRARSPW